MTKHITNPDKVMYWLNFIADVKIPSVRKQLNEGDRVSIHSHYTNDFWVIDDQDIHLKLPDFQNNDFPLEAIHNLFSIGNKKRAHLFDEEGEIVYAGDIPIKYRTLPFSKAIEKRIGNCLERSILFQLSQQAFGPSFFVSGWAEIGDIQDFHAFNILYGEGKLLLADVKPRDSDNGIYKKYVVPIKGIDTSNGEITLPSHLSDGRKYVITHIDEMQYLIGHYNKS